jgi:hypothetical protein
MSLTKAWVRHCANVASREGVPESEDDRLDDETRAYLADPHSHTDEAWGTDLLVRWKRTLNEAGVNYETSDAPGGAP